MTRHYESQKRLSDGCLGVDVLKAVQLSQRITNRGSAWWPKSQQTDRDAGET
jgi:hypothetical protein